MRLENNDNLTEDRNIYYFVVLKTDLLTYINHIDMDTFEHLAASTSRHISYFQLTSPK